MDRPTIAIIIVSILTGGALIGVFRNMKEGFGPFNLKVFGLTLIAGLCVIIALSDIQQDKLTPCYSILAAFAGYLFGLQKDK